MFSRRSLLLGLAATFSSVGLTVASEVAAQAAKTYTIAKTTEIPLKGGKFFRVGGKSVFITQPRAGVFRAFNAMCTHAGGPVNKVVGNTMVCASHGAKFDVDSGRPVGGPAPKALSKISISVSGTNLRVTI